MRQQQISSSFQEGLIIGGWIARLDRISDSALGFTGIPHSALAFPQYFSPRWPLHIAAATSRIFMYLKVRWGRPVLRQPLLWMLLYIALMVVPVNWAKRADSSCTVEIQILHLEGQNFSTTSISHSQILRISTSAPIFFCSSYRRDSFNSRSKDPEAIMWMCKGPSGLSSLVPRVLGRSLKAPTWFKTLVIST